MTRKMNSFIRRLQSQWIIPGFLENLGSLTLSNSKISESVNFVRKKMAKVGRVEAKFTLQRRKKHFISLPRSRNLFYTAVQVLFYVFNL